MKLYRNVVKEIALLGHGPERSRTSSSLSSFKLADLNGALITYLCGIWALGQELAPFCIFGIEWKTRSASSGALLAILTCSAALLTVMVIGLIGNGTGVMPATLRLSFKTSTKAERTLLGHLHCRKQQATGAKADSLQKGEERLSLKEMVWLPWTLQWHDGKGS